MKQLIEKQMEDKLQEKANQKWANIQNTGPGSTTVRSFHDSRPQAILDILYYKRNVEDLVNKYSNDMELGAAIRQYVNNNAK